MITEHEKRTVRFGDVAHTVRNIVDPETSGLERYIAGEHMDTDDLRLRRWGIIGDGYLGPAFHMKFEAGQILYGSRRTYLRKVALADFDGICANTTFVIEALPDRILPELLPFIMQTESFTQHSILRSRGSTNPYVTWSDIARYEFPLPPLDEQRRIAEILWAVEDAIEADSNVVNEIDRTIRILRVHLFGSNSHNTEFRLADLCDDSGIQIGPFGSQLHAADYVSNGSGVPVIMPSDMETDEIVTDHIARISEEMATLLMRHRIKAGDILLPRRGDLTKRAYVRPEQEGWMCGTGSIRVRVRNLNIARAVFHALSSKTTEIWLERAAVGTTMPNLNTEIVMQIPISLPEDEQTVMSYSDKIEQSFASRSIALKKVDADNLLKKTLIAEILKM